MLRYIALFLSVFALAVLQPLPAQASGLPIILSTTVDYSKATLTITGQNFGNSPVVTLDKDYQA
jgi:membrane protein YqaA with SNARE-associated domain